MEKENQLLKSSHDDSADMQSLKDKVLLLETLLADANKSKSKIEEDYMNAHQKLVKTEADLKRVSSGPSAEV